MKINQLKHLEKHFFCLLLMWLYWICWIHFDYFFDFLSIYFPWFVLYIKKDDQKTNKKKKTKKYKAIQLSNYTYKLKYVTFNFNVNLRFMNFRNILKKVINNFILHFDCFIKYAKFSKSSILCIFSFIIKLWR